MRGGGPSGSSGGRRRGGGARPPVECTFPLFSFLFFSFSLFFFSPLSLGRVLFSGSYGKQETREPLYDGRASRGPRASRRIADREQDRLEKTAVKPPAAMIH